MPVDGFAQLCEFFAPPKRSSARMIGTSSRGRSAWRIPIWRIRRPRPGARCWRRSASRASRSCSSRSRPTTDCSARSTCPRPARARSRSSGTCASCLPERGLREATSASSAPAAGSTTCRPWSTRSSRRPNCSPRSGARRSPTSAATRPGSNIASQLGELVGMEVVGLPVYCWGCAAGHAIRMAARLTGRREVLVPKSIDPERLVGHPQLLRAARDGRATSRWSLVDYEPRLAVLDLADLERKISARRPPSMSRSLPISA